jgi:hypothetical protein
VEGALPAWKELYHLAQSAKEGALPSRGTVAAKSSSTQQKKSLFDEGRKEVGDDPRLPWPELFRGRSSSVATEELR